MLQKIIKKLFLKLRLELNLLEKKFSKSIFEDDKISKGYIKKFLPKNPVIIDAGAHIGADSVEMYRLYYKPEIHAFEPVRAINKVLQYNTRKYKNIKTYCIALSDISGEQEIHVSSGSSDASSSLLAPKTHLIDHPDVLFIEKEIVKSLTLDEWARQSKIEKVDFLWLDLQGFELDVLKASKVIFPTVKVIHMEVSTKSTYEGVSLYPEVKMWMEDNNFYLDQEIIPAGWDMGNVLFVKRSDAVK